MKVGANVVLSKLPIGDLATQYFADRNIFCAGRVPKEVNILIIKQIFQGYAKTSEGNRGCHSNNS